MEVRAVAKYVRVQPRKVRIIADEVRGKQAGMVAALLRYHPSKSATLLRKVVISAMANAMENHNIAPEMLKVSKITVDEGPRMKRMQARAMGRGNRIVKKTSHITVVVEPIEPTAPSKVQTTKAKPRPKFEVAPVKKAAKKKTEEAPVVEEPVVVAAATEEVVVEPVADVAEVAADETVESVAVEESAVADEEKGAE